MDMSQPISPETQRTSKMGEHNPTAALTPPRQALQETELSWDRQSHPPMAGRLMIQDDPKGPLQHPKNMKNISQNRSSKEITDGVKKKPRHRNLISVDLASPPSSLKKFLALPEL